VNKYDTTYFFGRLNQIFLPHYSNQEVAKNMESIVQTITNPLVKKKLFTIGYGASGAGKTSSLIYLNKGPLENREGVVIHLCNRLGELGYDKATVTTKEFFSVPNNKNARDLETHLKTLTGQKVTYDFKDYIKLETSTGTADTKECKIIRGPFDFTYRENRDTNIKQFLFNLPEKTADANVTKGGAVGGNAEDELAIVAATALNTIDTTDNKKGGNKPLTKQILKPSDLNSNTSSDESSSEVTSETTTKTKTERGEVEVKDANKSDLFGNVHIYRTYDLEQFENNEDDDDIPAAKTGGGGYHQQGGKKEFKIRFPNPQFDEDLNWTDPDAEVNMGNLLIYLIDSDRFVKATTNNPNSSRSHVLLFLKMELSDERIEEQNKEDFAGKKLAKFVDIVIGDFAGVENKFDCSDAIPEFLTIERDIDPKYLYYKPDEKNEIKS